MDVAIPALREGVDAVGDAREAVGGGDFQRQSKPLSRWGVAVHLALLIALPLVDVATDLVSAISFVGTSCLPTASAYPNADRVDLSGYSVASSLPVLLFVSAGFGVIVNVGWEQRLCAALLAAQLTHTLAARGSASDITLCVRRPRAAAGAHDSRTPSRCLARRVRPESSASATWATKRGIGP